MTNMIFPKHLILLNFVSILIQITCLFLLYACERERNAFLFTQIWIRGFLLGELFFSFFRKIVKKQTRVKDCQAINNRSLRTLYAKRRSENVYRCSIQSFHPFFSLIYNRQRDPSKQFIILISMTRLTASVIKSSGRSKV